MRSMRVAGLAGALAFLCMAAASAADHAHWGYSGEGGPEHWGQLSPEFATCAAGKKQSPIDLARGKTVLVSGLDIAWAKGPYTLVNNGHTIQANAPAGGTLTIDDKHYDLLQLHFHAPSEHEIKGRTAPMEIHFVHREQGGTNLVVIGVMITPGGKNAAFSELMAAAPHDEGKTATVTFDPKTLLPASHGYWTYEGSLTTPPCSEIVHWIVMKDPLRVDQADIAKFTALYPMNARPVQPLNGRAVSVSP